MKPTIPVICCALAAMLRSVHCCSVAGRALTQTELYYLSTITVLGVFRGTTKSRDGQYHIWDYNLEVRCVLKNGGTTIPKNIIVRLQNPRDPSLDTCEGFVNTIYTNLEAIVMLEKEPSETYYRFWRENLSNPVKMYTQGRMSAILQVCGYEQPKPPYQAITDSCPAQSASSVSCTTGAGAADHAKAPNVVVLFALCALSALFL